MFRDRLTQGKLVNVPDKKPKQKEHRKVTSTSTAKPAPAVVTVVPKKVKKPAASVKFGRDFFLKSKIVFNGYKLEYHPREDGSVKRSPEEWKALEIMGLETQKNLENAIQELKDALARVQGRVVLSDYGDFKRRKIVEEEEEEDSNTAGSSSSENSGEEE